MARSDLEYWNRRSSAGTVAANLRWSWSHAWTHARAAVLTLIGIQLVLGLQPALLIHVTRNLVDTVVDAAGAGSADFGDALPWLAVFGLLLLLTRDVLWNVRDILDLRLEIDRSRKFMAFTYGETPEERRAGYVDRILTGREGAEGDAPLRPARPAHRSLAKHAPGPARAALRAAPPSGRGRAPGQRAGHRRGGRGRRGPGIPARAPPPDARKLRRPLPGSRRHAGRRRKPRPQLQGAAGRVRRGRLRAGVPRSAGGDRP